MPTPAPHKEIFVHAAIQVDGYHRWPDATAHRSYLASEHRHTFMISVQASVQHAERDIEFHDLKEELEMVVWGMSMAIPNNPPIQFGSMSCEAIALKILERMPHVDIVTVSEDESVGATVQRVEAKGPQIVTVCGSTRFKDETQDAIRTLTMEGHMVFSVGVFSHAEGIVLDPRTKAHLDELHIRKIDASDWIYVINPGGYIGDSTRAEIHYAERQNKPVVYSYKGD